MEKLSIDRAFSAMKLFLEKYFERTKSDEIGSILGDLQISGDGKPFDFAAWDEWLGCVERILNEDQPTN